MTYMKNAKMASFYGEENSNVPIDNSSHVSYSSFFFCIIMVIMGLTLYKRDVFDLESYKQEDPRRKKMN